MTSLQVKIFVVETPAWLAEAHDRDWMPQVVLDDIYTAGKRFLHTLLRDKATRTNNPCAQPPLSPPPPAPCAVLAGSSPRSGGPVCAGERLADP